MSAVVVTDVVDVCCNHKSGVSPASSSVHFIDAEASTFTTKTDAGSNKVTLRDWYVTNYCSDYSVSQLVYIQNRCDEIYFRPLSLYFNLWSELGNQTFYTLMMPAIVWAGFEKEGLMLCVMLSLGVYLTNIIKDFMACPRPPHPPVRRGGMASHGLEYGLPSTHTCCSCIMIYEFYYILTSGYPEYTTLIVIVGLIIIFHISFSRMYLGLHWLADIIGGLLCFVLLLLVETSFLRQFMYWVVDHHDTLPLVTPFMVGHILVVVHTTPRDPCPCFEDSVRFIGVDVGAIVGIWVRKRAEISVKTLPISSLFKHVLTLDFGKRYLIGILAVAVTKIVTSIVVRRFTQIFVSMFSGVFFLQIPWPFSTVYKWSCYLVGLFLGKRLLSGSGGCAQLTVSTATSHQHIDVFKLDVEPVKESVRHSLEDFILPHCHTETGHFWSIRNHNHWFEHDIMQKFLSYAVTGFVVVTVTPYVANQILGP